jgi:Flp pilus assembly protein TadD
MRKARVTSPHLNDQEEEQMRPSRFLGYNRDTLGMHALQKEMFDVAESQFRRATYLNPYEPRFKQHLAWALYKRGKYSEARRFILEALDQKPHDEDNRYILSKVEDKIETGLTAAH